MEENLIKNENQEKKKKIELIENLEKIYRKATKFYLSNHLTQSWNQVEKGLQILLNQTTNLKSNWWIEKTEEEVLNWNIKEIEKKFQILRITYLTSNLNQDQIQKSNEYFLSLLISIKSHQIQLEPILHSKDVNLQSLLIEQISTDLIHLHPSILTALALTTIRLKIPQVGKLLIEAWLNSFQSLNLTSTRFTSCDPNSLNSLGDSYLNLIQVYSVHILGSLDEWDFAINFIHSQSILSGGILSPEIVQNVLESIEQKKAQQIRFIKQAMHRQEQKEIEEKIKNKLKLERRTANYEKNHKTFNKHNQFNEHEHENSTSQISFTCDEHVKSNRIQTISNDMINEDKREEEVTGYSNFRNHLSHFISSESKPPPKKIEKHNKKSSLIQNYFFFFNSSFFSLLLHRYHVFFKFFLCLVFFLTLFKKINRSFVPLFSLLVHLRNKFRSF